MVLYYTFTCIQFQACSLLRKLRKKVTSGERNVQSMLNTVTSYTKEKKGVKDSHAMLAKCQARKKRRRRSSQYLALAESLTTASSQFSSTPYARKRERPRKVIKTALVPAYQSGIPSNSSRASTLAVDVRRPGP